MDVLLRPEWAHICTHADEGRNMAGRQAGRPAIRSEHWVKAAFLIANSAGCPMPTAKTSSPPRQPEGMTPKPPPPLQRSRPLPLPPSAVTPPPSPQRSHPCPRDRIHAHPPEVPKAARWTRRTLKKVRVHVRRVGGKRLGEAILGTV